MSLADLIKKRKTKKEATANSAKAANDKGLSTPPLAKLAALALADTAGKHIPTLAPIGCDATISRWWLFHYADRHPKEACYYPAATRDHALAGEPDAITAEAFEPVLREPDEPLSEKDEAVIRSLLADTGEDDEGIAVALELCRTDQDARDAFLRLAKQWQGGSRVE